MRYTIWYMAKENPNLYMLFIYEWWNMEIGGKFGKSNLT